MKLEIRTIALASVAAVGMTEAANTKCTTLSGAKSVKKIPTSFSRTTSTATVTRPWTVTAKFTTTVTPTPITISYGNSGNVYVTQTQTLTATVTTGITTTVDVTDLVSFPPLL